MTALDSVLDPDHFERPGLLYRLKSLITSGAALGGTARQLTHAADYPVDRYTPGGAGLSSANMAQAIRNAYDTAVAAGTSGTVLIPGGVWELGDEEFLFETSELRDNVRIRGAGKDCTVLLFESPYTGTAFKLAGVGSPGFFYANGGISDLSIHCDALDAGNTGCGIHIESCVNTQFRGIVIRNFAGAGGTGFRTRGVAPDGTNQYVQLWDITSTSNGINFDFKDFINCQAYGIYAGSAVERQFLLDNVKASFYGGNFQGSSPIAVELAGIGACRVVLYDFYYEGFSPTLFKLGAPSMGSNAFGLHGFILGGSPDILFDIDYANDCNIHDVYNAHNAGLILKARNSPNVHFVNVGNPITAPTKFDLDAGSALALSCYGHGSTQYTGGRSIAALGAYLPSYATGAEPASPQPGDVIRDSTYDRPSYRTASTWQRMALVTDDNDLSTLIAPYCAEIFDPQPGRLRSVISGELDSLTGLLHASVLSAPSSSQRPVWNVSDDQFGGRSSFSCAFTDELMLQGTLGVPIATGSKPGLLCVFRANVAGVDVNRRYAAIIESSAHAQALLIGMGDLNDTTHPYAYYVVGAGSSNTQGPATIDTVGHVMMVTGSDGSDALYIDQNAAVDGNNALTTTAAINTVTLGGAWDGSSLYHGCDVTIAYCAVLKQPLPADVLARVMKITQTKYGMR